MSGLKKTLSLFSGTILFLNIVIGAGLLVLPGLVYRQMGDLAIAAWVLCAVVAFPLLLVFIVLGRNYPDAGGISHYAFRAFGSFAQRAAAFIFLGAVCFGLPSIAMTGGYYISAIFHGSPHLYAAFIIILAALLHGFSGNNISRVFSFIGSGVIGMLLFLALLGALGIEPSSTLNIGNWIPKKTEINLLFTPFMMIFFAFTGWEISSHSAEEFRNSKRDFPLAMILSFVIVTLLYAGIAIITQLSNITDNYDAPFIAITKPILGEYGKYFVSSVATFLIFANLFGAIWGVSRLIYSLGRDSVFPVFFSKTTDGRPTRAIAATVLALLAVLLIDFLGFLGIERMLSLAGQNFLLLYGLAAGALFKLTQRKLIKLLSASVILLVCGILLFGGIHLIYPAALIIFAWLFSFANPKNRINKSHSYKTQ